MPGTVLAPAYFPGFSSQAVAPNQCSASFGLPAPGAGPYLCIKIAVHDTIAIELRACGPGY